MENLKFTNKKPIDFIGKKKIFNFLNLDSLWYFKNETIYQRVILEKENVNFPDGRMVGRRLKIEQVRGPFFTKCFLKQKKSKGKKHFFIGNVKKREIMLNSNLKTKEIEIYNPEYIKKIEFSKEEKLRILNQLKKFKPGFIWVGVGSPKQEILSNQLFKDYKADYFNVGAAFDYLAGNKKEAQRVWRVLGLEWFYRLITDFKHSKRKVLRHFIALKYLRSVKLDG